MKAPARRYTSWVAIFAILLNAIAPAAFHGLANAQGLATLEFCTAGGIVERIAPPGYEPGGTPATPKAVSFDHCPYCAPHGAADAAPPPVALSVAAIDVPRRLARAPAPAVVASHIVRGGSARAPPSSLG